MRKKEHSSNEIFGVVNNRMLCIFSRLFLATYFYACNITKYKTTDKSSWFYFFHMYSVSSSKEFSFHFFKKGKFLYIFNRVLKLLNTYRCCMNMIFLGVLFMRHERAVKMFFAEQTNKMNTTATATTKLKETQQPKRKWQK